MTKSTENRSKSDQQGRVRLNLHRYLRPRLRGTVYSKGIRVKKEGDDDRIFFNFPPT